MVTSTRPPSFVLYRKPDTTFVVSVPVIVTVARPPVPTRPRTSPAMPETVPPIRVTFAPEAGLRMYPVPDPMIVAADRSTVHGLHAEVTVSVGAGEYVPAGAVHEAVSGDGIGSTGFVARAVPGTSANVTATATIRRRLISVPPHACRVAGLRRLSRWHATSRSPRCG